jgi:hypothetical protein
VFFAQIVQTASQSSFGTGAGGGGCGPTTIASGGPRLLGVHSRSISQVQYHRNGRVSLLYYFCCDTLTTLDAPKFEFPARRVIFHITGNQPCSEFVFVARREIFYLTGIGHSVKLLDLTYCVNINEPSSYYLLNALPFSRPFSVPALPCLLGHPV